MEKLRVGAAFTGRLIARLGIHLTLVVSSGIEGLALLLIPLGLFGPILPLLMLGLAASGFWGTIWNVSVTTFRQRLINRELMGRVTAGTRVIAFGALPLGSILGGVVAQATSGAALDIIVVFAVALGVVGFAAFVTASFALVIETRITMRWLGRESANAIAAMEQALQAGPSSQTTGAARS